MSIKTTSYFLVIYLINIIFPFYTLIWFSICLIYLSLFYSIILFIIWLVFCQLSAGLHFMEFIDNIFCYLILCHSDILIFSLLCLFIASEVCLAKDIWIPRYLKLMTWSILCPLSVVSYLMEFIDIIFFSSILFLLTS